jgi:hypothetical protein
VGQKYLKIFFALALLLLISSCKNNRWEVEVSKEKVNIHINRFERELFTIDTMNWVPGINALHKKEPIAYEAYVEFAWPIGHADSQSTARKLRLFIADKYWQTLYHDVQARFNDEKLKNMELEFSDAFSRIHHFFPKDTIPSIYTIVKGFNPYTITPTIFTFKDMLGISLDMYMGQDYKYYVGWPLYGEYQIRRFREEFILPQALKTNFSRDFEEKSLTDQTVLSNMIYKGKILFYLDVMAPKLADSLKIEYTSEQLKWCLENEKEIWGYFAGKDVFFKTGNNDRLKFLQDGPFTNAEGIPREASPRLGEWVGWQIVRKYMANHSDVSLQQLFTDRDYRKILTESRYRPTK